MKISKKLNDAINTQIGEELFASNGYANMAAYFANLGLLRLSGLYFKQSEEEREHALKFVHYLMDVDGEVAIPAIEAATSKFSSLKDCP
jgi:bacterioferritin B